MRRLKPWLINSVAGAALAAGTVWGIPHLIKIDQLSSVPEQAAESLSTVGLSVEEVLVTGRTNTAATDLLDALGAVRGTPILDVDIPKAKSRIAALPWVKSAEIVRKLPNSLSISLTEHVAFALWQHEGRHILVAQDGTPIIDADGASSDLPVVVGEDAPEHANQLFADLAVQPSLKARLKAAVRYGKRRWDIHLDHVENGIVVKLPETEVSAAWDGLAALDAKNQLLSRAISEVDLRIAGRLIVRLKDGYAPLPREADQISAEQEVRSDALPVSKHKELAKGV